MQRGTFHVNFAHQRLFNGLDSQVDCVFCLQYSNEKSSLSIPSLTLCSTGKDKSSISHQAFPFLGLHQID